MQLLTANTQPLGCFRLPRLRIIDSVATFCPCARNCTVLRRLTSSAYSEQNPLEVLRTIKDPAERALLLQRLDGAWSVWEQKYQPSLVEACITEELGISRDTVMQAALLNPDLATYCADQQVRPCLRAMVTAGLGPHSTWFVVSKQSYLLSMPVTVQRWLDFLSIYGLRAQDIENFLLRAPRKLFEDCTLYQAGLVVSFLKKLGIKDEFLAARVLCVWPAVLMRSVEQDLRPIVQYLLQLEFDVAELGRLVCLWPELLLQDLETNIIPFVTYLQSIGCSNSQVADVLRCSPHLLSFKVEELIGKRLQSLEALGFAQNDIPSLVKVSTRFLTSRGGLDAQINLLLQEGFQVQHIKAMVESCPDVLAVSTTELKRKLVFARERLDCPFDVVMQFPCILEKDLPTVLGPRYDFVMTKQAYRDRLVVSAGQRTLDFDKLLSETSDAAWCEQIGASINEYEGYRTQWENNYKEEVHRESANEFQEELKKLGIYEGQ